MSSTPESGELKPWRPDPIQWLDARRLPPLHRERVLVTWCVVGSTLIRASWATWNPLLDQFDCDTGESINPQSFRIFYIFYADLRGPNQSQEDAAIK